MRHGSRGASDLRRAVPYHMRPGRETRASRARAHALRSLVTAVAIADADTHAGRFVAMAPSQR